MIPDSYKTRLNGYEMQKAISYIKQTFQSELAEALNLRRVSAPLFVTAQSGLNDDLSGVERPVSFDIPYIKKDAQVVHSLAKWKRLALKRYGFAPGEGLYTDMNAIRRDETLDNLHSVYVDQWDWEKIITPDERNEKYLEETVRAIVGSICRVSEKVNLLFGCTLSLTRDVYFISSQELEDAYPSLSPDERENEIAKKHKTVFVSKIGGALKSGKPHGTRAPDYDDWDLNGDIIFYNDVLSRAFEISSMGIRVDEKSLDRQLTISGCDYRRALPFHKALLCGELPLTIGGGIGQSRLCMLLLQCAHIGEVQSSVWDEETEKECREKKVVLL